MRSSCVPSRRPGFTASAVAACFAMAMLAFPALAVNPGDEPVSDASQADPKEAVATLAGGCFWCTEAVFERMQGVNDVVSGYIGGHVANPTYEQVCGKQTGHAEAVEIYYDPSETTYEELLEVFFKVHDPTTKNRQDADEGPQYRSAVFYHDEEQKAIAEKYIQKLNESDEFNSPIVTTLEKATTFYTAEEYHQDYFRRNPNAGYCQAVVRNKVRKFNREFGDKIKKPESR
jgi:methionine-S-sulfoxide reductase